METERRANVFAFFARQAIERTKPLSPPSPLQLIRGNKAFHDCTIRLGEKGEVFSSKIALASATDGLKKMIAEGTPLLLPEGGGKILDFFDTKNFRRLASTEAKDLLNKDFLNPLFSNTPKDIQRRKDYILAIETCMAKTINEDTILIYIEQAETHSLSASCKSIRQASYHKSCPPPSDYVTSVSFSHVKPEFQVLLLVFQNKNLKQISLTHANLSNRDLAYLLLTYPKVTFTGSFIDSVKTTP